MARKGNDEEELLSFSPSSRNMEEDFGDLDALADEEAQLAELEKLDAELKRLENMDDLDNIDDVEEVEEVEEVEALEDVEDEPVEELIEDEEPEVEEEPVEEVVEDIVEEEVVEPEEAVEEEIEEVVAEEAPIEEEIVEEVNLGDVVEEEVEPVYVPQEEVVDDEDDGYDRTNIFQHATVYYDQNTTILPRNFESRIRMASPEVKKIYSEIKNVLMEYSNVKSRMLKYVEVFRCGGAVAKMRIKGKSLYLYLKLDPEAVDQDYLKVVDKSERRGYEETPAEIKVTGKRKCKRSIEMIRAMMDALGIGHRRHPEQVDYAAKYPALENAVILGKNMVKVSRKSDYDKD